MLYSRGFAPRIVSSCDLVAIRLRLNSDLSALLQSVSFTMRVMQISSSLPSIMLLRVARTIVKYNTIVTDCSRLLKVSLRFGCELNQVTMRFGTFWWGSPRFEPGLSDLKGLFATPLNYCLRFGLCDLKLRFESRDSALRVEPMRIFPKQIYLNGVLTVLVEGPWSRW
jgi:hypothetical protein